MRNKWLYFVLLSGGIVVYYGLLALPPRIKAGNLILFILYVSASIMLIYRKTGEKSGDKS